MDNKHKAVIEYLRQYPELTSFLYFNTVKEEAEHTSLNTIISDTWEQKYLRGGIKNYDFAISIMKPYDTGTSDLNVEEIFNVQKFMQWIDEQNKNKNFPIFENGEVFCIENLQNEPSFSGINETGDIAKYMFQIRIKYLI
ncbi:hypothetical protein [[Clostridium] colinum]|uniref:hypothetical protein n=1 Tax=[Clostridium] colinum TaxID=36835 RepID=UPI0020254F61|nr:hypothetical protein [[Clostridium] colinum]